MSVRSGSARSTPSAAPTPREEPAPTKIVMRIPWQGGPWGSILAEPIVVKEEAPRPLFDKEAEPVETGYEVFSRKLRLVKINVGGQMFQTTEETLSKYPDSVFATFVNSRMEHTARDETGILFFDRNPLVFTCVLDFLRTGHLEVTQGVSMRQLQRELAFFKVPPPRVAGLALRETARLALYELSAECLSTVAELVLASIEKKGLHGITFTSICYVSTPYKLKQTEHDPLPEFLRCFNYATIEDDVVRHLCPIDARHLLVDSLEAQGVFVRHAYSRGDLYNTQVPSHVWLVAGVNPGVLDEAVEELQRAIERWNRLGKHW